MNPKEKIIPDYEKIINFVLKTMDLSYRRDELFDVGMIGFVNGINTFDETKGYQISTYLYECIKNELIKQITYEKRKKRDAIIVSLNAFISENTELIDFFGYEENYNDEIYYEEVLKKIMIELNDGFSKRQEEIFKYIYGIDGYPTLNYGQIAEIFKTSRQSIFDTHKRMITRLKKRFLKEKASKQ